VNTLQNRHLNIKLCVSIQTRNRAQYINTLKMAAQSYSDVIGRFEGFISSKKIEKFIVNLWIPEITLEWLFIKKVFNFLNHHL